MPSRFPSSWIGVRGAGRCFCVDRCEGESDVVGVVAPLGGVAQVVLHGIQVVEVGVQVRVHEEGQKEEDGEGQVEVEREIDRRESRRTTHVRHGVKMTDSRTT